MPNSVRVVSHPTIPSAYLCSFTLAGSPPEWVLDAKMSRRVFADPVQAEVCGYRELIGRINGQSQKSDRIPFKPNPSRKYDVSPEARDVFKNFGLKTQKGFPEPKN